MFDRELVRKTEEFLKQKFEDAVYLNAHPEAKAYRIEHTYRVANIGREIAVKEGFDETEMVLACLLHDVAYCEEFGEDGWKEHGRHSAQIARPFLTELGLPADRVQDICYGIAIHVDEKADFPGENTPFALTVGDADNIDRFDAYRIHEGLALDSFLQMSYEEKKAYVGKRLSRLRELRALPLGTKTAKELWRSRLDFYIAFFQKLADQLERSQNVVTAARQNIYDDPKFFEGYKSIRESEASANTLFEIPALFSLLPDLKDMSVLDLGCGFGEHCVEYVKKGARKVVGIDISENMLEVARKENSDPRIEYINLPIEELDKLSGSFDLVVSSLAFHYVEDFTGVVRNVHKLLNDRGTFVFSQEHPLTTSYSGTGPRWTKDESGKKLHLNLAGYGLEGEKISRWLVEGLKKYHRTFSTIINTLTEAGFTVEKLVEPLPDKALLDKHPEYHDLYHKPDFLIIKAVKR